MQPVRTIVGDRSPDCNNCAHFYITHDANLRYGCRALNFKSQKLPMLVVIESSGQTCHYFVKKAPGQN